MFTTAAGPNRHAEMGWNRMIYSQGLPQASCTRQTKALPMHLLPLASHTLFVCKPLWVAALTLAGRGHLHPWLGGLQIPLQALQPRHGALDPAKQAPRPPTKMWAHHAAAHRAVTAGRASKRPGAASVGMLGCCRAQHLTGFRPGAWALCAPDGSRHWRHVAGERRAVLAVFKRLAHPLNLKPGRASAFAYPGAAALMCFEGGAASLSQPRGMQNPRF